MNSHISITVGALVFIYLFHNRSFYFVRNMFMVAMGIALVGYSLFPTAPPRFLPGVGLPRRGLRLHRHRPGQRRRERALQPLRRRALDARRFALMIGWPLARLVKHRVFKVVWSSTVPRHLRRRGDRQPLLDRRLPRRRGGRVVGATWPALASPARGRRCGRSRRSGPARRPDGGAAPRRPDRAGDVARSCATRLIESRLTPNAISLTGFALNVVAAVLVWQRYFFLAGVAFIVGSICDTLDGRYSRMSRQGHAVRRVPRLDAGPHRGGDRPDRRRRLLRRPRRRRSRWPRPWPRSCSR